MFSEIDKAYDKKPSIFDSIGKNDLVVAFFPCTRFEDNIIMYFTGKAYSISKWSNIKKIEYAMKLHEELHRLYMLVCKLFILAYRGGWKLIVENPDGTSHYLKRYFPIQASLGDNSRLKDGDYYHKPTQYWFVNCVPEQNIVWKPIEHVEPMRINHTRNTVLRSMIHPQYAERFIKQYIIDLPDGMEVDYTESEEMQCKLDME